MVNVKVFNKISPVVHTSLSSNRYTLSERLESYEAALVRSADLHSEAFPPQLVSIARAGAGVNNIPVERCSEQGIVVFNTPGANANAVKELVLCGMLLAGRKVIPAISWAQQMAGEAEVDLEKRVEQGKGQFGGPELAGKRLGVIGLGAIGVMVANAARQGLGMEVMGYDPYMSVSAAWHLSSSVMHATTLEEIYSSCDYISLHLPLGDKTRGIVGETAMASMKPEAVILNFARGPLVDSKALISALDSDKLRGYVTDFPSVELCGHDKIIAIPHLGASTPESEENCAKMAATQLREYMEYGTVKNAVNLPDCELPMAASFRLAIINRNITNMVGQITALLAESGSNIDHMINKSRGNWAYTLIDMDQRPTPQCVEKMKQIDGVVRVRIIQP